MLEQIRLSHSEAKLVGVDSKGVIYYEDLGRWRCWKCDREFFSSVSPPVMCPKCNKKSQFDVLSPPIFDEPWTPYGEPIIYGDLDGLFQEVCGFIRDHLVLRSDAEYMIMALWIIASYKQGCFDTVPYLQFIGPIESGKTRGLRVLDMLAYRPMNNISISPSALCRMIELFHPTVLLDQAEQKFNLKSERGCEMYDIFMSGYQRGQNYVVASKDDDVNVVSRDVFGFKAVASTRVFDEAFTSRSIQFKMKQDAPVVKRISTGSYDRAAKLRNMLLYFHLKEEVLPDVDVDMIGRRYELFYPLLCVGKVFDVTVEDVKEYLVEDREKMDVEMSDTLEADILREIKIIQDAIDVIDRVRVGEIAMRLDVKPHVVGYRLKNMNIPRGHGRDGAFIDFNDKKTTTELSYLYSKYHVEV